MCLIRLCCVFRFENRNSQSFVSAGVVSVTISIKIRLRSIVIISLYVYIPVGDTTTLTTEVNSQPWDTVRMLLAPTTSRCPSH